MITAETARRIGGREDIVNRIFDLARNLAAERGIQLTRIKIRPAWSHEHQEQAGVVIDVHARASNGARFSYWHALNQAIEELASTVPGADAEWLVNELSLIVART